MRFAKAAFAAALLAWLTLPALAQSTEDPEVTLSRLQPNWREITATLDFQLWIVTASDFEERQIAVANADTIVDGASAARVVTAFKDFVAHRATLRRQFATPENYRKLDTAHPDWEPIVRMPEFQTWLLAADLDHQAAALFNATGIIDADAAISLVYAFKTHAAYAGIPLPAAPMPPVASLPPRQAVQPSPAQAAAQGPDWGFLLGKFFEGLNQNRRSSIGGLDFLMEERRRATAPPPRFGASLPNPIIGSSPNSGNAFGLEPPIMLAPDGSYTSGQPRITPDGSYVGGTAPITIAPDGTFTNGPARIAPDGAYVGGAGPITICPDGSYAAGGCRIAPDGSYLGK